MLYGSMELQGPAKLRLARFVVDETLARKSSESVGTAYFYIRHDDNDSKKPSSILGSLISQLLRQNSEALAGRIKVYRRHLACGTSTAFPDDHELIERLLNTLR